MSDEEGGRLLPPAGPSFDREGALRRAMEKHVLPQGGERVGDRRHAGEAEAYDAALGDVIVEYLDSLPPKDLIRVFLGLRGASGVDEERFLSAQADSPRGRAELLAAAKELRRAGELRRVRSGPEGAAGRIRWVPGPKARG